MDTGSQTSMQTGSHSPLGRGHTGRGRTRSRRSLRIALLVSLVAAGLWFFLAGSGGPSIEKGSTLLLELSGTYQETVQPSLFARFFGDERQPFVGLLSTLALAERDDRLDVVVLRLKRLGIGWGKAQELRAAIGRIRARGRKVIAVLELQDSSASIEYYVACAADEVYAVPGISVPLVGLAAEYLYLGGLWEKIGVEFQVARVGRYKSAVETYTGEGMSDASREMVNSLLDSIEGQFVNGIAVSRGMTVDDVREAINTGPVLASQLVSLGLLDGIKHVEELAALADAPVVRGAVYRDSPVASVGFEPVAHYALIYGSGTVVAGRGSASPTGSPVFAAGAFSKALEAAGADSEIDAIILRIDSPGGSAAASEEIWYAIRKLKSGPNSKPVIASFSDVAASGGYYVASAADGIVASPGAITGSIGVFALRPSFGGLLDKLGIKVEWLTRGDHADMLLSTQPLSEAAQARLQQSVVEIYELFLDRVASGRSLSIAEVDAVGQGRVWTAAQAFERGLVDELGGLHTAVKRAKRAQGLAEDADVALIPYPQPKPLLEQLAEVMDLRLAALARSSVRLPGVLEVLRNRLIDLPEGTPLLIPPIIVDIH